MNLEILFQDENLIAVNKPHGLLVHRTSMAKDADTFALQLLRNQLKHRVYPAHRLDRKTSGCLLFAKNKETVVVESWQAIGSSSKQDPMFDQPLNHTGFT